MLFSSQQRFSLRSKVTYCPVIDLRDVSNYFHDAEKHYAYVFLGSDMHREEGLVSQEHSLKKTH